MSETPVGRTIAGYHGEEDVNVPEDPERDEGLTGEAPSIAHDDIMKRLLAYRERLRAYTGTDEEPARSSPWPGTGGSPISGGPPSVTATEELVDVASVEPEPSRADLEERMAALESALDRVDEMLRDLRRRFQDLAVVSDERIEAIRRMVAEARGDDEAR